MFSRLSTPRRSSLFPHLLRHFSIQRAVYSRSADKHSSFGISLEFPVQDHGLVQEEFCCDGTVELSVRSRTKSKRVQHNEGAVKLLERSSTDGNNGHHSDGEMQLFVPSQAGSKRVKTSDGDAKLSHNESREVHQSKAGRKVGKRTALQTLQVCCKSCLSSSKSMEVSRIRTGPSEEISSLASQSGGDSQEPTTGNTSNTERDKGDDEQSAVKQAYFRKKNVPSLARETSEQVNAESTEFVRVYSVVIKRRKVTDEFLRDLQQKIDLLYSESVQQTQVEALLKRRGFLSASPEKLAAVLKVLKQFFECSDMACDTLTVNAGIIERPLEQLEQRLQVLAEFEVDKATCHKLGTCTGIMSLKADKYKSVLTFLKELGLSAESRNKLIGRRPALLKQSEKSMQSTLDFFGSIGMTGPKLLNLLETRPELFGSSIENNLMVKHKLLQKLGFSTKQFGEAMMYISKYSNGHVLSQYEFLIEQGMSHEDVTKMLRQQPSILSKSVENLKAKLHFLRYNLNRDVSEVVSFPAYLAYSFNGRIIPRFKALEEVSLSLTPRLSSILSLSSSSFKTRFKILDP